MVKLILNKDRNRQNQIPKLMYQRKKKKCVSCVKQLLSRDQAISPLIDVLLKSTKNNTKGISGKSATVTYLLISNAKQLKDQYFPEFEHSRPSYNSSVVLRQQDVLHEQAPAPQHSQFPFCE